MKLNFRLFVKLTIYPVDSHTSKNKQALILKSTESLSYCLLV